MPPTEEEPGGVQVLDCSLSGPADAVSEKGRHICEVQAIQNSRALQLSA